MDTMRNDLVKAVPALGHYPQEPVSTGTTLIAMEYDGGVIVGTDSRTSSGSGSAADTQTVSDVVKYQLEVYSMLDGEPLSIHRATQLFRDILYKYRDSLSASVLVAGWDKELGGQVASLRDNVLLPPVLDRLLFRMWKPNMTKEECIKVVKEAVALAVFRDGSSGGVIRIGVIDKDGTNISLYRPDGSEFPQIRPPTAYPTWPTHSIAKTA